VRSKGKKIRVQVGGEDKARTRLDVQGPLVLAYRTAAMEPTPRSAELHLLAGREEEAVSNPAMAHPVVIGHRGASALLTNVACGLHSSSAD